MLSLSDDAVNQVTEKLLLLTGALKEAVSKDDFLEAQELAMDRESLLQQLENSVLSMESLDVLKRVFAIEEEIKKTLQKSQRSYQNYLLSSFKNQKAISVYSKGKMFS